MDLVSETEVIWRAAIDADDTGPWVEHLRGLAKRFGEIRDRVPHVELLQVIHDVTAAAVTLGEWGHTPDWPEQQLGECLASMIEMHENVEAAVAAVGI